VKDGGDNIFIKLVELLRVLRSWRGLNSSNDSVTIGWISKGKKIYSEYRKLISML